MLLWAVAAALIAGDINALMTVIGLVLSIALMRIAIVSAVKRCHEHGWSGWWAWMALVPVVGIFWFALMPGKNTTNQSGDPDGGSPFRF
jgi:uncharacterized membrane protein YhaH (DUF805 family)